MWIILFVISNLSSKIQVFYDSRIKICIIAAWISFYPVYHFEFNPKMDLDCISYGLKCTKILANQSKLFKNRKSSDLYTNWAVLYRPLVKTYLILVGYDSTDKISQAQKLKIPKHLPVIPITMLVLLSANIWKKWICKFVNV